MIAIQVTGDIGDGAGLDNLYAVEIRKIRRTRAIMKLVGIEEPVRPANST